MRSIFVTNANGNNAAMQIWLDRIDSLQYVSGNVNIGVSGTPAYAQVAVTSAIDAAAVINQINKAMNSGALVTMIPGSPDPVTNGPDDLAATPEYGQISLAWTTAGVQYAYNIYRSTDNVTFTQIGSSTTNSYTDTQIATGTTYYYEVTTYTVRGESPPCPATSGVAGLIPAAVTGLATTPDYYQNDLSWTAVTGDTLFKSVSYNIYRNGTQIGATASLTYSDAGLTAGTTYNYTVTAVVNGAEGPQCAAVSGTPVALVAPSGVGATQGVYAATVGWTAPAGATAFNLYRGTTSGAETLYRSGLTGTSFTDTGLRNDTVYYYKVTATANDGESPQSAEVSVQPSAATFASCSPNPASVNDGVLTFTGTGFDSSQGGVLQFGTVSITQFACSYLSSTQLTITYPGGMTPGAVQFYYNVAGSLYKLPFLVTFQ